ncbi:hypothetical protein BLA60_15025 [Actinophytocola xinjiangensis]|uniref:Uncharacterized protein n=1 Tax=Actinophytocola xinjiangensis TaxID=485602 RepID=A0A7Z0WQA9_9PSEU|nr:hypothetical protein BLA60_15025 [Actinophytocola xinjiangensis]
MLLVAGAVVFALHREQRWTASRVRALAVRVSRLDAERAVAQVRRFAEQLRRLSENRRTLAGAMTWAALNWLFDAAACGCWSPRSTI